MRPTTLTRCVIAAALLAPLCAPAQVTTNRSASIIIFPKVVADGTSDTVVQIANEGESTTHAHCFYVNGARALPDQPPGPSNPASWELLDFDIFLTTLQPTHWVASRGRPNDPTDGGCTSDTSTDCDGAGFDPGRVPALPPGFRGELLCFEVDTAGAPISGDHLIGAATLQQVSSGDVAKYNAIGLRGRSSTTNSGDGVLCLGGEVSADCPTGAEYDACPDTWTLNHLSDGSADPLSSVEVPVANSITVVPCSHDLETQVPTSVTLQFVIINEFEQAFSASTTVTCWSDTALTDINELFSRDTLGGEFVQTRIRALSGGGGFLVVAQATHGAGGAASSSMTNLFAEGVQSTGSVIRVPLQNVQPGVVR